jgi:glycosyltransferase involved in cell wall biosynthesis
MSGATAGAEVPWLSVVVPFYRSAPYIERCLAALADQTYPADRFEILPVDNNSPDDSRQIVSRYSGVRLLHEPRQSAYAARNRGWREATGEIVVFVDADCVPAPDWLGRLVEAMDDPGVDVVVGPAKPAAGSRLLDLIGAYEDGKERYILARGEPALYVGHAGNMAVRRSTLEELGPFLEHARGSDTTLVRRVVDSRSCTAVRYAPAAEVRHLEVARPRDYLRKMFLYGRSWFAYRRVNGARTLSHRQRLTVFRGAVRKQRLRPHESSMLFAVLLGGMCCWSAGVASGAADAAFRRRARLL